MVTETRSTPALTITEDRVRPPEPTDDEHYERAEAILNQLVRFMRLSKRAATRFASAHVDGIEQAAYIILYALVSEGPRRTTALAEAVHSDTSTVSRQVGALVRHGLVERQADPADGRACLLAATPRGVECFEAHRRARTAEMIQMLTNWSNQDLREGAELLDRLNGELERYETEHHSHPNTITAPLKGGNR
ncbi:MAG TPA: MarR family winged helix-turn-helix transcriptional regulator [Pseudonocardiaceae bacterium]|jgi:DNA-binding MarR family transcriptional regulator|nr:MarR family winged helix-turn-helix transcriptional regulator [Pseudonocardiaceae bacterium]